MFSKSRTLIIVLTFFKCPYFFFFLYTTDAHLLCWCCEALRVHCDLLVASVIIFFSLKKLYTLLSKRYIQNIFWWFIRKRIDQKIQV